MASPFAIFRKNQRVWMAGAVFIAIVAFVISPAIQSFTNTGRSSGRSGANPLVASWSGGSIHRDQLEREYEELGLANAFLRRLAMDVREKGGNPNVPEFSPDLRYLGIGSASDSAERILERKLLVAEAKRRGIVFDEHSVKTFLEKFVDRKLNGEKIEKVFKEATQGRLTWFEFNHLMCEELAKNEVLRLAGSGLRFENRRASRTLGNPPLTTPGKNWQDFLRFNRSAKIQAFPVFARDFESQVQGKPSEKEILDLYQEGKNVTRTARTIATQPAFMRPKTADFEYLSIDMEKVINEQMALIPEETLRAEYTRRVAEKQFRVPVTPEATSTAVPETKTDAKPESKPESEPATETKPSDSPVESEAKPSSPTEKPELPPVLDDPKPNALRLKPNSDIKLVAFQDKPAEGENPQPPAKPTVPVPQEADAAQAPADSKPSEAPPTSIELSDAKPPLVTSPSAAQSDVPPIAESTEMRTKTFEEVKDQIARELASGVARKAVEDRISSIFGPMSIYKSDLNNYQQRVAAKDSTAKQPARLKLEELGKSKGFEFGTTGMVDSDNVVMSPIGSSFIMPTRERQQAIPFAALINQSDLFEPINTIGFTGGNRQYLLWKTEETQPVAPSVSGVRDQIIEVWRKQQAFKLAETRARELASKVGSATLADSLATPEEKALILEPTNFTWYNPMFARMESRLQLSTVEFLQPIDNNFMEAVFAIQPGETTVAPDSNKTVFYVVKVIEMSPDTNSLLDRFAASPLEGVATVSRLESDRAIQPWFQNLQKQLGFRAAD